MSWVYDFMLEWVFPILFLGLTAIAAFYVLGLIVYWVVIVAINALEWAQSK